MDNRNMLQRFYDSVTGREDLLAKIDSLGQAVEYLTQEAYVSGPYELPPDELVNQLNEYDPQLVADLVDERLWETFGSTYGDREDTRNRILHDNQALWINSPLYIWQIQTWTNYGLGDTVRITTVNPDANEVWTEFMYASRNNCIMGDDNIHELSNWTLVEGNTFLACFASTVDGAVTVEEIPTDEIKEIITNPNRSSQKWFYKREYYNSGRTIKTAYYPDWEFKLSDDYTDEMIGLVLEPSEREKRADLVGDVGDAVGTDVCVIHIAHNKKVRKSHYGWPLITNPYYIRAHKRYMQERMTLVASVNMYARRKKVKGGTRAVNSVRSTIQSALSRSNYTETNPRAVAGSVEIDNAAIDTKDLPLRTGGSDAKNDHEMFAWLAGLSGGLFPVAMGLDTQRYATALEMDKTLSMQWSRYRTFWSAQFRKLVYVVLRFAELYGGHDFGGEYDAQINIDSLSLVDFPDIVNALAPAVSNMLTPYIDNGIVSENTAKAILRELWLIMLQALGVSSAREIASMQAFDIDEPAVEVLSPEMRQILNEFKNTIMAETNLEN